ncbi:MAG: geranylgeranylglyceryl/heptaprenylglyceryl phosphate synthase, partial [Fulvivirga sp.]|uniref:geranylgeranylglyceryl/heptaprenylglyceryl phosphate synthase n=1 Tax=Fulvivirga sp. TaxID=1931237 RepID=UPI0032EA9E98
MNLLKDIQSRKKLNRKSLAVLIDPDKVEDPNAILNLIALAKECYVDFFFVGGSLLTQDNFQPIVKLLKEKCDIPVILFPGNNMQISNYADAILFLSLISGRNPDFLIGQHVNAAPL